MKLSDYDRYEIKAEAFRIMTGHMAPGKDAAPESYPAPFDERFAAFERWQEIHGECARAMLKATERMVAGNDDDA